MSGIETDGEFAVLRTPRGISLETYKDRRAMVEEEIRMLFVDLIFHSGKDRATDNVLVTRLADDLAAKVRSLGTETLEDWYSEGEPEDSEDEPPAPAVGEPEKPPSADERRFS